MGISNAGKLNLGTVQYITLYLWLYLLLGRCSESLDGDTHLSRITTVIRLKPADGSVTVKLIRAILFKTMLMIILALVRGPAEEGFSDTPLTKVRISIYQKVRNTGSSSKGTSTDTTGGAINIT